MGQFAILRHQPSGRCRNPVPGEVIVKASSMLNLMQKKAVSPVLSPEAKQTALKNPPVTPQLNLFQG